MKILMIAVVVLIVLGATAVIVEMIVNYKKENRRIKEILEKNENRLKMDTVEDGLQMAYAGCNDIVPTERQFNDPMLIEPSNHFTDTGTSMQSYGYNNGKIDRNFVIVKSVIYTETREELN
jgi:hypothetical protein